MIFHRACPGAGITTNFVVCSKTYISPQEAHSASLISPSPVSPNRGMLRVLAAHDLSRQFHTFPTHHIHIYLPRRAMPLVRWPCSNHREGLVPHGRRLLLTPFSVPGSPLAVTFGPLEIVRAERLPPSTPVLGRCESGRNRNGVRSGKRAESHDTAPDSTRLPLNYPKPALWLPTPSAIASGLARLLRTETCGRGRLEGDLQPCVSHLYRAIEAQMGGVFTAAGHAGVEVDAAGREQALAAVGLAGTHLLDLSR